jgi:hypothetical protein
MKGLIIFEVRSFSVRVGLYLLLTTVKHKVEHFEIAINDPLFLSGSIFLIYID